MFPIKYSICFNYNNILTYRVFHILGIDINPVNQKKPLLINTFYYKLGYSKLSLKVKHTPRHLKLYFQELPSRPDTCNAILNSHCYQCAPTRFVSCGRL